MFLAFGIPDKLKTGDKLELRPCSESYIGLTTNATISIQTNNTAGWFQDPKAVNVSGRLKKIAESKKDYDKKVKDIPVSDEYIHNDKFADFTLICTDGGLPVHKFMLYNGSDYFKGLFEFKNITPHHECDIEWCDIGCSIETAKIIVQYMYDKTTPSKFEHTSDLCKVAEKAREFLLYDLYNIMIYRLLRIIKNETTVIREENKDPDKHKTHKDDVMKKCMGYALQYKLSELIPYCLDFSNLSSIESEYNTNEQFFIYKSLFDNIDVVYKLH